MHNDPVTVRASSAAAEDSSPPGTPGALMEAEIAGQPAMLERLLAAGDTDIREVADVVRRRDPSMVLLVARGTSDHAALYLKYLIEVRLGLPVGLCSPSAHTLYGANPWGARTLVIGISQSGESPDLVATLASARIAGATTIAVTNAPTSDLAQAAELTLDVGAGSEHSVAATKSYTAELLAVFRLVEAMQGFSGSARGVPAAAAASLDDPGDTVAQVARELVGARSIVVTGRGFAYPTAREAALKLMETCYLPALAFSAADLRHGPFALLAPGTPVLVLAPAGRTRTAMVELVELISATGASVTTVGPDPTPSGSTRHLTTTHDLPEDLAPIVDVIPLQRLALATARARGLNPDRPRALRKITETY
ncbi:SIS domain-containing protein [Cellulomonas sp. P24]|uniref:SIS domain-containing protein n=1 Tax=Cellulomonas sp. P24 TaxID=2885206 RepID=UPI00216B4954|nr:SIS domain-containing protein [Cellulomonas sp. P24]MCR6493559.1 SIS domain-containing protein [Cellulomonas sp. P24]